MAIKTRQEMEQVKQDFINKVPTKEVVEKDIWSLAHLKRLTTEQIVDRMDQINNQSFLYTCRLLAELRTRFPSDTLFGQYMEGLRNHPEYPLQLGSQPRINKMIHVGRFCEEYKIADLTKAGILKSAIVELARPAHKEFAGKLLHQLRKQNLPIGVVMKLIETEKKDRSTVLTVDQDAAYTEEFDESNPYEMKRKYIVDVEQSFVEREVDGTIVRDKVLTAIEPASNPSLFGFEVKSAFVNQENNSFDLTDEQNDCIRRRTELLTELAAISGNMLTEEQRIEEYVLLSSAYEMSAIKLIPTVQAITKYLQSKMWGK